MSADPPRPEPPGPRPTPAGLRPFQAGLWFGGFNGVTWMVGLGSPMVLMAERLGADAAQVGLASAFVFLTLPIQVLATSTLTRLGYRRQMVMGWGIRALFLLVPLSLALSAPAEPAAWMVPALVASVFGFCFFRAFGVAAHVPWLAAILPVGVRGRYYATDALITSSVGVATLLLSSALFDRLPGFQAFAVVYALAVAGSTVAIACLFGLPSAVPPAAIPIRALHRELRRLWFEPGDFRFFLLLTLLGSVVGAAFPPFATFYLRVETGLPESTILRFAAAQFAGQIAGVAAIRIAIDRAPLRRFFRLAALGAASVQLFWLVFVSGAEFLVRWLPAAYFAFGAAAAIQNTAQSTILPELSPEERRPVAMAVFTATLGVLSGLAPVLWGIVLGRPGGGGGIDVGRFVVFFALGIACQLALVALLGHLRDRRQTSAA